MYICGNIRRRRIKFAGQIRRVDIDNPTKNLTILRLQVIPITLKLHTYIIGHYNPSVRIIDLVAYSTYVVCVNTNLLP